MGNRLSVLLGVMLVIAPQVSIAQGADDDFSPEALLFEEIPMVVSATRTERSLNDVPNAMTVITAKEIHESGAATLEEALQIVPGLEIMRVSNNDVNMSARGFNGANSSNLLVMIDGRSAYIDHFGIVLWESMNVTMEDIERIEVVRGPGSALYGANAFLGTVNIITKKARDLPALYVQTGQGPDTNYTTATTARTFGRAALKASARYRKRDYFRNKVNSASNVEHDRHNTDLRTDLFRGTFEYQLADDSDLRVVAGALDSKAQIYTAIGSFDYEGPEYSLQVDYTKGPWTLQGFWTRYDYHTDTIPTGLAPAIPVLFQDRLEVNVGDFELQRELRWQDHELLIGFNARRVTTESPNVLGSKETDGLYAMFMQDEYRINDRLTAFLSLRADEHPKTGFHLSPRAGLVAKVRESDRLRMSFGRAFQNPTQVENYAAISLQGLTGPPPAVTLINVLGNEELDPVWATSYDIGYQTTLHPRLTARVDLFFQVHEDFHQFFVQSAGPPSVLSFQNADRTKSYGGELTLEFKPMDTLRGFATYSFQEANGTIKGVLPRHKATLGLRGSLGSRFRYSLTGVLAGHSDFDDPTVSAPPEGEIRSRFTVDGFMAYQLTDNVELGFKARNLFHQVRRHNPYGDEIGSEIYGTLTVQF